MGYRGRPDEVIAGHREADPVADVQTCVATRLLYGADDVSGQPLGSQLSV